MEEVETKRLEVRKERDKTKTNRTSDRVHVSVKYLTKEDKIIFLSLKSIYKNFTPS